MKPSPQANNSLHAELADWFVRRGQSQWTAADEKAFQTWLQADPARPNAWRQWVADWRGIDSFSADTVQRLRNQVMADHTAAAVASSAPAVAATATFPMRSRQTPRATAAPISNSSRNPNRRRFASTLAIAGVAGVAAGGVAGWQHLNPTPLYQQEFTTTRGQTATATLPDGSVIELDAMTRLEARFYEDRREIRLTQGQAAFAETKDAQRPFEVRTSSVLITVIGTRFAVRHTPDVPSREATEVSVSEGRVRVARTGLGGLLNPWSVEIGAGQRMAEAPDGGEPTVIQLASADITPWKKSLLTFNDAPLEQAIAEMQRYADLGISAIAPDARNLRLSGSFAPRDVASTRRLLTGALPIEIVPTDLGLKVQLSEQ